MDAMIGINMGHVMSAFVLFGGGLTLLTGIEQLTGRKSPGRSNVLLFAVAIVVTIILGNWVMLYRGVPRHLPWAVFLFLTAIYLIGPLNYLYYRSLLEPGLMIAGRQAIHLAAPLAVLALEIAFQSRGGDWKSAIIGDFLTVPSDGIPALVMFAGGVSFFVYQAYFVMLCLQFRNEKSMRTGVRLVLFVECFNMLSVLPVALWFAWKIPELVLVSGSMTTMVMIFVFLFNNRFRELFAMMTGEIIRKRYERSFLTGVDTSALQEKLSSLMESDKLFREPDLNLNNLASRVGITSHQLSQYLNERLGIGFAAYINRHRVEEARALLADMTVLEICYHVGFSSKSSFNSVFKAATGLTPTEFRGEGMP